jgi:hypothetical protein
MSLPVRRCRREDNAGIWLGAREAVCPGNRCSEPLDKRVRVRLHVRLKYACY